MNYRFLLALIIMAWLSDPAEAGTCNGLLGIAGPLVSVSTLAFGNYDATQSDIASNATITVACTVQLGNNLPSFVIALSAGQSNSFTARQMNFLTSKLNYNLYTTSSFTTVWGDGTGGSVTQSFTAGSAASTMFTVYGKLPKGQYPAAGLYGDTIIVTVTY